MTADSVTRLNAALEVRYSIGPSSMRVGSRSPLWAGECAPNDAGLVGASDTRPCTGWRSAVVWVRYGLAMIVILSGCDLLSTGTDLLEGLTNPLVLQGLVLSIDAPPSAVDLASAGLVEGASATVFLADAAEASALAQVPVREAEVRLTGQGFDAAVVAVFGPAGLTYSNVPGDIEELYAFTRSEGNPVVWVPGSALGQTGGHAVGVAGLVKAGAADFDHVNTLLSSLGAGKMVFASVTVQ
ncbi:hypothetical protein ACFL3S_06730 [Gemmatimonadota bacterium]